ncbi:MAG: LysM peptidoglycan-binding domain-containing protein [Pirellulales bacterium]|nr:LysM peptidoglycan-binding domain-containing protein [Pirellulales bacterium]
MSGKETKIGLAVLGALAVTLVVVLVMRMTGSSDDTAATNPTNKKSTKQVNRTTYDQDRPSRGPHHKAEPTVVRAKPAPSSVLPGDDMAQFRMAAKPTSPTPPSVEFTPPPLPPPLPSGMGTPPPAPSPADAPIGLGHERRHHGSSEPGLDGSVFIERTPGAGRHGRFVPGTENQVAQNVPDQNSPVQNSPVQASPVPPYSPPSYAPPYPGMSGMPAPPKTPEFVASPAPVVPMNQGDWVGDHEQRPHHRRRDAERPILPEVEQAAPVDPGQYEVAEVSPKRARMFEPAPDVRSLLDDDPAPARSPDGTYRVQPNDSYWIISRRLYGTESYFKALAEHNRSRFDDDRLDVGDTILAPDQAELEQKYPDLCPDPSRRDTIRQRSTIRGIGRHGRFSDGSSYEVQAGDNLFDIARFELGDGARWPEIYRLNKDSLQGDFNYLTPGMKLVLPNTATPPSEDRLTRRPGLPMP